MRSFYYCFLSRSRFWLFGGLKGRFSSSLVLEQDKIEATAVGYRKIYIMLVLKLTDARERCILSHPMSFLNAVAPL